MAEWSDQTIGNAPLERRARARYPMTLDLRYAPWGRHSLRESGTGRTIDLSSAGLRFAAGQPLLVGERIEVYIDWPALLDGGVKLQLVIRGEVVRSNGTETALQIKKYDFRTRRPV